MIVTPRASHCFSSLIWLSRNKSLQKSRFSRIVKNSREFSLLDLVLQAFWFHFSLLKKEWRHCDFTLHFWKRVKAFFFTLHFSKISESIFFSLHFSKKSESFFISLFTSRSSKTHSRWSLIHYSHVVDRHVGLKNQPTQLITLIREYCHHQHYHYYQHYFLRWPSWSELAELGVCTFASLTQFSARCPKYCI